MTTAAEYRQFAEECIESARQAPSEQVRKQFLDIAKLWVMAASKLDGAFELRSGPFQTETLPRPLERPPSLVIFGSMDDDLAQLQDRAVRLFALALSAEADGDMGAARELLQLAFEALAHADSIERRTSTATQQAPDHSDKWDGVASNWAGFVLNPI